MLFDEAVQIIGAAVLPWAGVPAESPDIDRRARQLATIVDGFAKPGPAYVRATLARRELDRWARHLVSRSRSGQLHPAPGSALHVMSSATDRHGGLLPDRVAAVELLNIVRPTVATAWFVAFAGKALHEHPQWRERITAGDQAALEAFVQEVRRLYPFTPWLTARARHAQDVHGIRVPRGGLVVLDVYGTLHDPAQWANPEEFDPSRFLAGPVDPDVLVPQGGGDVATGHRCPGEGVVVTLLTVAVRRLAELPHSLPSQELGYDLSEMPTRPKSGVTLDVSHDA